MQITTAWVQEDGWLPTLISVYDENTREEWNGVPDFYTEAIGRQGSAIVRELVLEIPDWVVAKLFRTPTVSARLVVED